MSSTNIDYDALAKQLGALSSRPLKESVSVKVTYSDPIVEPGTTSIEPDYDALAKQFGATTSQPSTPSLDDGEPAPTPSTRPQRDFLSEVKMGVGKGAASTAIGLFDLARKYIPGLRWASDRLFGEITDEDLALMRSFVRPQGVGEQVGFYGEQIGEFFVPGGAVSKSAQLLNVGQRLATAAPKLAKVAPVAEGTVRGILEAIPAVTIAKAQGQEDTGSTAAFAMAGPTIGQLLNKVVSKGLPAAVAAKIPEVGLSPRQMMWKALKPYVRNRDFDKALDRAVPEIYEQARMMGKTIKTVDDFLEVLKETKRRIWAPYRKMLQEATDTVDGEKIADALEKSILKYHAVFSPKAVKKVSEIANVYRANQSISLSDAEDWLQVVNAQIRGYYNKYPQMRNAAEKTSPLLKAKLTEAAELRAAINKAIDDMGGIVSRVTGDPMSAKYFKEVYGGLQNLEQEALRRVNVSKRLAPESLAEQMGKIKAAGELAWGLARGKPLEAAAAFGKGVAYKKVAEMLKERNTSDYLIKRAFEDFGKSVDNARKLHRIPTALNAVAGKEPE